MVYEVVKPLLGSVLASIPRTSCNRSTFLFSYRCISAKNNTQGNMHQSTSTPFLHCSWGVLIFSKPRLFFCGRKSLICSITRPDTLRRKKINYKIRKCLHSFSYTQKDSYSIGQEHGFKYNFKEFIKTLVQKSKNQPHLLRNNSCYSRISPFIVK